MKNSLVTVFGGSGFLGRYIVPALLKDGARVRIAARTPGDGWYLKTQGGLGQTQFVSADVSKRDSVDRAIAGSDAAINLVGILKGDFERFHVTGARNVSESAAAAGVAQLVHMSAIGADRASASGYGKSKGEGEDAVRAAFPSATILRPSIVFGREDQFVNRFADLIRTLPVVPIISGSTKFQPVFVGDVARAAVMAIAQPLAYGGQSYDLGGPEILSMAELNRWIANAIGRTKPMVTMPDAIARTMARTIGWLPGAPMTWDQWLMLQSDNIVGGADGLKAMAIAPTPLDAVAEGWLVRYRRNGRFAAQKG